MPAQEGAEVAHDAGAVFVNQQQDDAEGNNLGRLAEDADDAWVIGRAEKGAAGGNDLVAVAEGLDVEPFVEGDRLARTLLPTVRPSVEAMLRTLTLLRSLTEAQERKPRRTARVTGSMFGNSWALPPKVMCRRST